MVRSDDVVVTREDAMIALTDLYYAYAIPLNKEEKKDAMEDAKMIIDKVKKET